MQFPSPLVTGWLDENRKPSDFTRALATENGSGQEGAGEHGEDLTGRDGKD